MGNTIFFWELNVPQNISLGDMAAFYLAGALINRKLAPQESAPIRPGSNLFLGSRQVWITVL